MSQPTFLVDEVSKNAPVRREPLGAGFFGQRGSIAAHAAENSAEANGGRPSIDQFEDHYRHSGQIAHPGPDPECRNPG